LVVNLEIEGDIVDEVEVAAGAGAEAGAGAGAGAVVEIGTGVEVELVDIVIIGIEAVTQAPRAWVAITRELEVVIQAWMVVTEEKGGSRIEKVL
jgi:hypothetical protein